MSQRNRLFLLLFAATGPMVALAVAFVVLSVRDSKQSAQRDAVALARAGALAAESFFDGHVRTLNAMAVGVRDAPALSEPELRQRLVNASQASPEWGGMSVARENGIVIAGSRQTSAGADLSSRPYFRQVMATGKPVVSDGIVTVVEGVPAVLIATPVTFTDGSKGALIGSVTLETLAASLTETLTTRARLGLVDSAGQALVHPDRERASAPLNVADRREVAAGRKGETGTIETDRGGEALLVAYAPVGNLRWVVTAAEDRGTAYGDADAIAKRGATFIALALAAVALGVWYVGGRLNRSYAAVQEAQRAEAAARERAEAALRSRDEFISIASHELRNPVAAIRGFGQLLQRRLANGPMDERDLREYVDHVAGSGLHLSRLVEDLLSVSRLEGGRLELQFSDVDFVQVLRRAIAEAPLTLHEVRLTAPDTPVLSRVDADRVTQILVNLLENAAKYSPAESEILVDLTVRGDEVSVAVTDTGIGLPPEDLPRLFAPFARASNARDANISGLGLGLYVSRRLADAHGGSLMATSRGEGKGSTFTLTLPLSPAPSEEPETAAEELAGSARGVPGKSAPA